MLVGRSRCLSWEGEQQVLHLEVDDDTGNAAQGAVLAAPLLPSPSPHRRDEEVAQLQAYIADLGSLNGKLEEVLLPAAFPALVERALQERREENAALRGAYVCATPTDLRGMALSAAQPGDLVLPVSNALGPD